MAFETSNELARQFVRRETRVPARLEPSAEHGEQFRPSFQDSQTDYVIVDVSEGGLGLVSAVYLPRNLQTTLHVPNVTDQAASRSLTIHAVVRRCTMTDHKPTFLVGLQFVNAAGDDEQFLIKWIAAQRLPEETVE